MPTFAAIDIGSNSVRLKIARLQGRRLHPIHEDREVTRLGEWVFKTGFLSPEAMAETVKVLRRFHRAAQRLAADTVRVVATSALRDARSSRAFLEWLRSATGWKVEIIVAPRAKAVIATSGTAAALAAVASHLQKGPKKRHPANVSRALMERIAKLICRLPIEDRRKLQGIGPRRAEIIAAGALVYDELLQRCHLRGFRYSPLGLRDGLLVQMAAEYDPAVSS